VFIQTLLRICSIVLFSLLNCDLVCNSLAKQNHIQCIFLIIIVMHFLSIYSDVNNNSYDISRWHNLYPEPSGDAKKYFFQSGFRCFANKRRSEVQGEENGCNALF